MYEWMNEWMNVWMNVMNEWMNECMNEWMYEWMRNIMNDNCESIWDMGGGGLEGGFRRNVMNVNECNELIN